MLIECVQVLPLLLLLTPPSSAAPTDLHLLEDLFFYGGGGGIALGLGGDPSLSNVTDVYTKGYFFNLMSFARVSETN